MRVTQGLAVVALTSWVNGCGVLVNDGKYYLATTSGDQTISESTVVVDAAADTSFEASPADHATSDRAQDEDASIANYEDATDRENGEASTLSERRDGVGKGEMDGLPVEDAALDRADAYSASAEAGADASQDAGAAIVDGSTDGAPCSIESNSIEVSYYTQDAVLSTATIQFNISLTNLGTLPVELSDLTVRYWFSADGNDISSFQFVSYSSWNANTNITSDVTARFARAPAANLTATSDAVLEIGFDAEAGSLAPSARSAVTVLVSFQAVDFRAIFDETNDYSFDASKTQATGYQTSSLLSAYVMARRVAGCEPSAP